MDFQRLNRRELQSLCKLNKIPANITNVAMADALSALPFVQGIEEFLMVQSSQMSETADSSIESPEKTEVMSPRVPRTSCRTSTRRKPLREEAAETLQTATRTTARRTRKAPAASARLDMKIQLKESGGDEKVEEASMHLEKKSVPETPSAVPNSRRKGPAASTRITSALKEESMFGRTYSTRRSARLKEKTVAEPTPIEKERAKLDKVDSVSDEKTLSFSEMLDEGSDDLNAFTENSSISGSGHNAVTVGMEGQNELLELGKDKTSAHTDMHTESTADIDVKFDALERSYEMEVDVIPSDNGNPTELCKLNSLENITLVKDVDSEGTIAVDIQIAVQENSGNKDIGVNVHPSEQENPCEILDMGTVKNISSCEDMGSVDITSAEMEVLDSKGAESAENSSETSKMEIMENVGTFEEMDSDEKTEQDMESVFVGNNAEAVSSHIEKPNEPEPLLDDEESKDQAKIGSDLLKMGAYAAQDQNQDSELPELHPIEDTQIEFAAEEKSYGSVESANGDAKQESFNIVNDDIGGDKISGSDSETSLELMEHLLSGAVDDGKVADITETHNSKQVNVSVDIPAMDISEVDAIPTQMPPSKTPLKKSASKTPATSRRMMALVSDDKENIDRSGKISQPAKDVGKKIKKEKGENDMLNDASLRQLTKMLKEKLQITNGVKSIEEETNITKVGTTRPALQTLSSNSLASN